MKALALLVVSLVCGSAQAIQIIDAVTQYGFTSEQRTVMFQNNCARCDRHEWQLWSFERKHVVTQGQIANQTPQTNICLPGTVNALSFAVTLPRTGHYYITVRSCIGDTCSAWASSMVATDALINCLPRAWWIYGVLQPPGQPAFTH